MVFDIKKTRVGVVGLGYVGLPLAIEMSSEFPVVGFDLNSARIAELRASKDATGEVADDKLMASSNVTYTEKLSDLEQCNFYIITVPTPVTQAKQPDLTPIASATQAIASIIKSGDVVVYESTVYPGVTEEYCVPIIEKTSGLTLNVEFFVGYSPERINPGDKEHTLRKITKLVAGSTEIVTQYIHDVYATIIDAGVYIVSSIKVAEAAKVIENTQRDVNIALINELCMIFDKLNIDTTEVLNAASTKWNFLNFRPGFVGGHCIGVDPYYLTYCAEKAGFNPEIVLSGRRTNDFMPTYAAKKLVKNIISRGLPLSDSKILVLGITFKENCTDIRNTKVVDLIFELKEFGLAVDICDPFANVTEVKNEFGIELLSTFPTTKEYSAVVIAVAHSEYRELTEIGLSNLLVENGLVFDLKSIFGKNKNYLRL